MSKLRNLTDSDSAIPSRILKLSINFSNSIGTSILPTLDNTDVPVFSEILYTIFNI
jgi:hypothetical protein